jgi:inosine-uridine nucleoside N-ribohydrolase
MAQKVMLVADPGIDGAVAIALALNDPGVDVLGVAATAGNVDADQATANVQTVLEQIDPPRWPRPGAALPVDYDIDGKRLHGANGLGGVAFASARLHHPHPGDKLLIDLVRQYPKEVTVVCLGPLTVLARALDRDPELPVLVQRFVCVGGSVSEPGNAGPVSEFHFACDPAAARRVLRCGAAITLIPLDAARKALLSPTDVTELCGNDSRTCRFLSQIIPPGILATSNLYGIEGFHVKDVLGVLAVAVPAAVPTRAMAVDVETRGELTRGMSVVDQRPWQHADANAEVATGVDKAALRAYMEQVLRGSV